MPEPSRSRGDGTTPPPDLILLDQYRLPGRDMRSIHTLPSFDSTQSLLDATVPELSRIGQDRTHPVQSAGSGETGMEHWRSSYVSPTTFESQLPPARQQVGSWSDFTTAAQSDAVLAPHAELPSSPRFQRRDYSLRDPRLTPTTTGLRTAEPPSTGLRSGWNGTRLSPSSPVAPFATPTPWKSSSDPLVPTPTSTFGRGVFETAPNMAQTISLIRSASRSSVRL